VSVAKQTLKPQAFPWVDQPVKAKFKTVFVYIMGGITYEEAAAVNAINEIPDMGMKVFLGGSYVHNSRSFISDVLDSEGHAVDLGKSPSEDDDLRVEGKRREAKRE